MNYYTYEHICIARINLLKVSANGYIRNYVDEKHIHKFHTINFHS